MSGKQPQEQPTSSSSTTSTNSKPSGKPIRGILKNKNVPQATDTASPSKRAKLNEENQKERSSAQMGGAIQWDEATIAEHDLLRGTRMKIEEPKTPYHEKHGSDSEEEEATTAAVGHFHLSDRLAQIEARQQRGEPVQLRGEMAAKKKHATILTAPMTAHDELAILTDEDDEEDDQALAARDPATLQHKKEFEKHRKMHYDEFRKVKQMRDRNARLLRGEPVSSSSESDDSSDSDSNNNNQ